MKYEKEIEEILQCSFRKEWMSDEDWQMFKDLLKDNGVSIENMSKEIEIGGIPKKKSRQMEKNKRTKR